MRQSSLRAVQRSAAPHLRLPPSRPSISLYTSCPACLCCSPIHDVTSRRAFYHTQPVLAEATTATRNTRKSCAEVTSCAGPVRNASTSSSVASPASGTTRSKRGEEIRRNEQIFRWLRRLVVPAFFIWGLFVLRPTEGHFLRYVAERRHLDTEFNAWFPPVVSTSPPEAQGSTVTKGAPMPSILSKGTSKKTEISSQTGGNGETKTEVDVSVAFRSPQDRDWAAQKFHYKKGSEDEERVARRLLLFARERSYLPDDTVVETIRSPEEKMAELKEMRDHPPMYLLSEQLDAIAQESKRYRAAAVTVGKRSVTATLPVPPPPQVLMVFEDHRLFATAAVVFRDKEGNVGRTMRFVGACGMLWKQLS